MTDNYQKLIKNVPYHKSMSAQKYRMFLFVIASLALLSFLGTRRLIPFLRDWQAQTAEIQKKAELIKEYEGLLEREDILNQDFDTLSREIQTEIPVEREESQFLTEIEKVASRTYVHISTMNPQPFKDFGAFKELSVEIEMEANLGNLARFLYDIKKSSVVLVANRLSLQPKSERSALLKGQLVISTIFLKEK